MLRVVRRIAITGLAVSLIAGCASSTTKPSAAGGPTSALAQGSGSSGGTYTIGVITDLTGVAASEAGSTPLGIKAGVGRAAEGGFNIRYIIADTDSSPAGALSAAQKLVEEDHVFAVVGISSLLFAAAPYLHSKGVPVIGTSYDGTEWLSDENMFSIFGYSDYTKETTTIGQLVKKLGGTNLATIGYGISPSSAEAAKASAASAVAAGLQAGYVNANVPFGTTNVSPLVLAMKSAKVDSFYPVVAPNTGLAVLAGMRDQGVALKVPLFAEEEGDLLAGGPAARQQAKGVYLPYVYQPVQLNTSATKTFQADLKKYANVTTDPTANEYIGYLSIDGLIQGLKAAGPNPTQASFIQTMLGITDYDGAGLLGSHSISFSMSARGQAAGVDNCAYVVQWTGSDFKLVAGAEPICGSIIPGKTVTP